MRTRVMSTVVTETSRLSTYSLKKGPLLQAPSPLQNGRGYKETCLCTGVERMSLKDDNSLYGSSLLNEKIDLLHRRSAETDESLRESKHLSAFKETDILLSPSNDSKV